MAKLSEKKSEAAKKPDMFDMIMAGRVPRLTVETKRGAFKIRYPLPHELRQIEIELAKRLGDVAASSFSEQMLRQIRVYVILDYLIEDAPPWWKKMKGAEECPDDELVAELYRRYLFLYNSTQASISGSADGEKGGGAATDGKDASLGDGAFSDLAHGEELPEA